MQNIDNNPRRSILKKIPLAIASFGVLSFFQIKRTTNYPEKTFSTLAKSEADDIIKNEKIPISESLKPSPAPFGKKNIIG